MDRQHTLRHGDTLAVIQQQGAELSALDAHGHAWLWDAQPSWPRHAPVLFPIVGRLQQDSLLHDGQRHGMTQHGFARDRAFRWLEREERRCSLELTADTQTRALYPFDFRLVLEFTVGDATLRCVATVGNPGQAPLPFSVGAHPAFRWPLPGCEGRDGHRLRFPDLDTQALTVSRLRDGLLSGEEETLPIPGDGLPLDTALFARDALVFRDLPTRRARFCGPSGAAVDMRWDGYRDFGVWTKPQEAPFLCLEPWRGHASPAGWEGEFNGKPGIVNLPAGEEASFTWTVDLVPPGSATAG
ncbi:aldose 1-epimerase family protein [Roseomonas elaeocarpi]|uniref:Aldose 1-epimerase family protein n=1 Tax=Roseomonas elaeocarpi TaxID=907779 RepID=A0ABV6JZY0_9PROT